MCQKAAQSYIYYQVKDDQRQQCSSLHANDALSTLVQAGYPEDEVEHDDDAVSSYSEEWSAMLIIYVPRYARGRVLWGFVHTDHPKSIKDP